MGKLTPLLPSPSSRQLIMVSAQDSSPPRRTRSSLGTHRVVRHDATATPRRSARTNRAMPTPPTTPAAPSRKSADKRRAPTRDESLMSLSSTKSESLPPVHAMFAQVYANQKVFASSPSVRSISTSTYLTFVQDLLKGVHYVYPRDFVPTVLQAVALLPTSVSESKVVVEVCLFSFVLCPSLLFLTPFSSFKLSLQMTLNLP